MKTLSSRTAILALLVLTSARVFAQAAAPPNSPVKGDVVPAFDAEAIDGTHKHVDYPKGSETVLLFFLSSCPTCHKMIPEWNRMYDRRPKGLRVIGVMLDHEAPGFFEATPISFPVLRAPAGGDFRTSFKIARVPLSLRVGAAGRVEDAALGLLDPIRLGQIFHP